MDAAADGMTATAWAAALAGVLAGSLAKSLLDLWTDRLRFGRDNKHRDRLDRRAAYVAFVAALEDVTDARILMEALEEEREGVIADYTAVVAEGGDGTHLSLKIDNLSDEYVMLHRSYREAHTRINAALAVVRITGTKEAYARADTLCDLANYVDQEDPERRRAMTAFLNAVNYDLDPSLPASPRLLR